MSFLLCRMILIAARGFFFTCVSSDLGCGTHRPGRECPFFIYILAEFFREPCLPRRVGNIVTPPSSGQTFVVLVINDPTEFPVTSPFSFAARPRVIVATVPVSPAFHRVALTKAPPRFLSSSRLTVIIKASYLHPVYIRTSGFELRHVSASVNVDHGPNK